MKDDDEYHVHDDRKRRPTATGGAAPSAMLTPAAPAWLGRASSRALAGANQARRCQGLLAGENDLAILVWRELEAARGGYCGRHFRTDWWDPVAAGRRRPTVAKPF